MSAALEAACAAVAAACAPAERKRRWLEGQCQKLAELVGAGRLDLAVRMLSGLLGSAADKQRGRRGRPRQEAG